MAFGADQLRSLAARSKDGPKALVGGGDAVSDFKRGGGWCRGADDARPVCGGVRTSPRLHNPHGLLWRPRSAETRKLQAYVRDGMCPVMHVRNASIRSTCGVIRDLAARRARAGSEWMARERW